MEWDHLDEALRSASGDRLLAGPRQRQNQDDAKQANKKTTEERNRELAIHHAKIIQQKKDLEMSILQSIILLIDYPTSRTADPANPSREDAETVKHHLRLFQISDYDDLINERNIEKQCGYVLCPLPHRPIGRVGKLTILTQGTDLQVVNTSDVMRWCSDECARRAMYLRVQISQLPAWERNIDTKFDIMGEPLVGEPDETSKADKEAVAQMAEDLKKLALERGNPSADIDQLMTGVKEMSLPPG